MCVGSLAGVTYLRYTVLTSPNKGKTAVHCCDPPLSVLVMLVSRNVFHEVSALQSIVFIQDLSGSWCVKGTDESTLVTDSSVHDPDRSWITDPDPDHPKGTHP